MKIPIGKHDGESIAFDLDALLTTRLLIQANSGAGKSWLLRVLMEQLFGHVQVIAIDPEGEFATLREKFDYALVGAGGEIPADVRIAADVAEKLLELRISAVCDLYEMKAADRHAWVARFLSALVDAPKKLWHPVIVVVDEAHMFAPEKSAGESEASGPMIDLCTRGRKRGFCPVWATQRLANVNKQATAMLLNRLVGGTFEDVDIKRALELLSVAPEDKRDFSRSLKTLEPGFFYAFGRAVAKERTLFRVGPVQTSHPQPGSSKHAQGPPPAPDKIKAVLAQLAEIPREAEEKARTIADLKKQVVSLKNDLAAARRSQQSAAPADPGTIDRAISKAVTARDREWRESIRSVQSASMESAKLTRRLGAIWQDVKIGEPPPVAKVLAAGAAAPSTDIPPRNIPAVHIPARQEREPRRSAESNGNVSSAQHRILTAIAEWEALGRRQIAKTTLAVMAGVSSTSSGYANNLGALRSAGYIDYPQGGFVALTDKGRNEVPAADPPGSPAEMLDRCKRQVSGSQARILEVLASRYPDLLAKGALADLAGASSTSSGFANNLGSLRTAGMIDYPQPGMVRIESWIMLADGGAGYA